MKCPLWHRSAALISAVLPGCIGVFILIAWSLDRPGLATLGAPQIPMAPITALMFILFSLAIALHLLRPNLRGTRPVVGSAIFALGASGSLELLPNLYLFPLPWHPWGFGIEAAFNIHEIGRMATPTAVSFLLTAVALAAQATPLNRQLSVRWIGNLASLGGLLTGAVILLAYAGGSPLGYEPQNVPMALTTGLCFMVANAGLLIAVKGGELVRLWRDDESPDVASDPAARFFNLRLVVVLVALTLAMACAGLFYVRYELGSVYRDTEAQLLAIAQLKSSQIATWKNDRIRDAVLITHAPELAQMLSELNPAPKASAPGLLAKLAAHQELMRAKLGYAEITLLDRGLMPAVNNIVPSPIAPEALTALRERFMSSRSAIFQDLLVDDPYAAPCFKLIAPIFVRVSGEFVGAAQITINASDQFFPLIQKWPSLSTSGESMLIRREGDRVLYLNPLRHSDAAPLSLSFPLDSPQLLEAQALRNAPRSLIHGTDYRGVPVLGVATGVPDSPWIVIAKIDKQEALAPMRDEALQIALAMALILAIGSFFVLSWARHEQHHRATLQLRSERAARLANDRLASLMLQANDVVLLFDENMRIIEANQRTVSLYQRSPAELLNLNARILRSDSTVNATEEEFARAISGNGITFESLHRRKDGTTFPVEVSSRPIEIEGRRHLLSLVRDVTERKAHEHEIGRLNRLYRVISHVNQALARVKSRDKLFDVICRVLVDEGRFRIAWIGWLNPETLAINPVAVAGDELGYVAAINATADSALSRGNGIAGVAVRENHICICNDFQADPAALPWREAAARSGFNSAMSLPLHSENHPVGVLCVYSDEKDFFSAPEIGLMQETADDLSLALEIFSTEAKRLDAEQALRSSEERYRVLFEDITSVAIQGYAADGTTKYWNKASEHLYGFTRGEAIGRNLLDLIIPAEIKAGVKADIRSMVETGVPFAAGEFTLQRRDGSIVDVYSSHAIVQLPGRPLEFFCVDIDITERKKTELALRESHQRYDEMARRIPVGLYTVVSSLNGTTRHEYGSEKFFTLLGFSRQTSGRDPDSIFINIHPEDRVGFDEANLLAARTLQPFRWEGRCVAAGTERWLRFESEPTPLSGGDCRWNGVLTDITERRKDLKQLQQLSRIVEQAPLSIAITDLTGAIEYVNPTFLDVTGYTFEEVIGQNPRLLKSGLTSGQTYNEMWATLRTGKIWRGELNNIKKNGDVFDELAVIAPVTDPSGKITHYVALKQDITERKAVEVALRDSELRFRELFDLETDAILVIESGSGRIVQANQAATVTYGYSFDTLLTMRALELSAEPGESARALDLAARLEKSANDVVTVPLRHHRRHDGSTFPAEMSIRNFVRDGRVMLLAVVRDITEQVKAREQLERFNTHLEEKVALRTEEIAARNREIEAILKSIPDLVLRMHADGSVLDLKPAKDTSPLEDLAWPDSPPARAARLDLVLGAARPLGIKSLNENTSLVAEVDMELDHVTLSAELRVAPIGSTEYVVIARDITERKRLEAAMAASLENERRISEMKTRFISVTSHEFRTPMAAAMASADLLHNHLDQLAPAKREELFDRIKFSLQRMTHMLDDILLLNRVDANRVEVRLTPVNLLHFSRNVVEEIRLADHDAHNFEIYFDGDLAHFPTDTNLLHHILGNLLSNAVRYSPAGTAVTLLIAASPAQIILTVEDRGIGVPVADRSRIFDAFERGSNVCNIKGTGLGLNIVRRMTGLLGGTTTLESPPEGATRFTLSLPRLEIPQPATA